MVDLSKIDELIRARAYKEAAAEAAEALKALPFWKEDIQVFSDTTKTVVSIERWRLLEPMQKAIKESLTQQKIEFYSKKILDAVDELDWLRNSIENLERNQ